MRRKRLNFGEAHEEASINLTPLIDVVFVVLIMFIIIAPMLELDRIELASAAHKESKEAAFVQHTSPITIHVRGDNTILLNNRLVSVQQLMPLLCEAKKSHPQHVPQLFQDKKAQFGTYQTVKNALEMSGFEQLDIILQPD